MEKECIYWEVDFISCEGNSRYTVVRTPSDWDKYDVNDSMPLGGCGDDIAEITGVSETHYTDYTWDFCE